MKVKDLANGNIGVLTFLTVLMTRNQAFQVYGEEGSMEAFVELTSDDPKSPLTGSDLWVKLKRDFPTEGGGIDSERIAKEMAGIILKKITG